MGNRAIIKGENMTSAVYLHWNGGRDSVEAFLEYCKIRGFDKFNSDYGFARFLQVVSNFMGGDGLSVGLYLKILYHLRYPIQIHQNIYYFFLYDI